MNQTVISVLAYLCTAGTIAVLLERFPGWQDKVPAKYKVLIVTLVNLVAPTVLAILRLVLPPETQNETVSQLLTGLAMAAASFIAHQFDDWLKKLQNSPPAGSVVIAPAQPNTGGPSGPAAGTVIPVVNFGAEKGSANLPTGSANQALASAAPAMRELANALNGVFRTP